MNTQALITGLALSVGLLLSNASLASKVVVTPDPPAAAAEVRPAKVAKKNIRKKAPKRYSKATLSAFKPLPPPDASAAPALLKQEPALELKSTSASSGLAVPDANEPDAGQDLLAEFTSESSELGSEGVSVIDRVADKPKAQPIVSGPLRVRVQEKGLRASVQIPITLD